MSDLEQAIAEHDARLRAAGLSIWIGGEPTFTDRWSFDPAWNFAALGADKEERARRMLAWRARRYPGCLILRTLGRQYPGEEAPRWSYGLYRRRDGHELWQGPPDPLRLEASPAPQTDAAPRRLLDDLERRLQSGGHVTLRFAARESERLLFGQKGAMAPLPADDRLQRPSWHGRKLPEEGAHDDLAAEGWFLLAASLEQGQVRLELPEFPDVPSFLAFLAQLAPAAGSLPALVLGGFAPPVDEQVAFATYTPDPAVVENNMAPAPDLATFLAWNRELYDAAAACGLHPFRLLFNGLVGDSGGGGHLTLGGPAPDQSPFVQYPQVLPQLIRYFNRHPCLSYLFAVDAVGSSSQSPRADEGVRESFEELMTSLLLLSRIERPSPETLDAALAPFMADRTGNAHRAELNMEKFWNAWLPRRGKLGVIEFRALRMARSPERGAALGALLRAIVAMLARRTARGPLRDWTLIDWGAELHDRFALPFFLKRDLGDVLASLESEGFGLGAPLTRLLLDDSDREIASFELGHCSLRLCRAVEFWPLIGDAASQESRGARLMDSSSQRVELVIRAQSGRTAELGHWEIAQGAFGFTPSHATDDRGEALVTALRYRAFVPQVGLHPTVGAQSPLRLTLLDFTRRRAFELELHEWRPDGQAYEGLPRDEADAAQRRAERVKLSAVEFPLGGFSPPPQGALSPWCLDLRRC